MKRVARFRPQPDAAVSGHGDHFRCGLLGYRELDNLLAGGAPRLGRRLKGDIFGWGREDYCWPCGYAPLPAPPLLP